MRINNNMAAINTANALKKNQKATQSNLAKLSSGYAINKAADNAAGLAVSETMRSQIRGLKQASKNATDGVNLINTAEGYMKTATDILQRMRDLAVQSANGTYNTGVAGQDAATANKAAQGNRAKINEEIQQLTDELDRLAKTANHNGMQLSGSAFSFQVGANTKTTYTSHATYASNAVQVDTLSSAQTTADKAITVDGTTIKVAGGTSSTTSSSGYGLNVKSANDSMGNKNAETITAFIGAFDSESLHVKAISGNGTKGTVTNGVADDKGIDLTTQASANKAITTIDAAISQVTSYRAQIGAVQNRLEYTIDNIATSIENTTASESAIRDTDMVEEMMDFTKNNVKSQAATAMMAQANAQTQSVLQLLQ